VTDWAAKEYRNHAANAVTFYGMYKAAQKKVDEYELKAVREAGSNLAVVAERLSGTRPSRDWYYQAILGAKNGIRDQLLVEIQMALMFKP
jgi:hypothetical protein